MGSPPFESCTQPSPHEAYLKACGSRTRRHRRP
jgi:hypothetical protein